MHQERPEVIWIRSDISEDNKLYDSANCNQIVLVQYFAIKWP
jgi:hypothetical protein